MNTKYGIGLMSGSSLDGIDLAYVKFDTQKSHYNYEVIATACIPYHKDWIAFFKSFALNDITVIFKKDQALGRLFGTVINEFIKSYNITTIDFIANHGHTLYHNPAAYTTVQIGNGSQIAALTGITTIDQLRLKDVALGGQGAPIVPIMDLHLLSAYTYCLNIGGIANITVNDPKSPIAFDICAANQILNYFAQKQGMEYDKNGSLASTGTINWELVYQHHEQTPFLKQLPPKSLDNAYSKNIIAILEHLPIADALATACAHIAYEIKQSLFTLQCENGTVLITGGGAKNSFLVALIKAELASINIKVIIPEDQMIDYKEAIAMAFIGYLRLENKKNVLHQISGAQESSINGCIWAGH